MYLSHIFMLPPARGTVLTYWLRIAPVELAVEYLFELHQRGLVELPAPDAPGKYFGVQLNLAAEMGFHYFVQLRIASQHHAQRDGDRALGPGSGRAGRYPATRSS